MAPGDSACNFTLSPRQLDGWLRALQSSAPAETRKDSPSSARLPTRCERGGGKPRQAHSRPGSSLLSPRTWDETAVWADPTRPSRQWALPLPHPVVSVPALTVAHAYGQQRESWAREAAHRLRRGLPCVHRPGVGPGTTRSCYAAGETPVPWSVSILYLKEKGKKPLSHSFLLMAVPPYTSKKLCPD